jgi:hypothetical protein
MEEETLFGKFEIGDVLTNRGKAMLKDISSYDADSLLNTSPEDLAAFFAEKYEVDVPELSRDGTTVESSEIQIDVTYDRGRHFIDEEHHYVRGTQVIYHVPFSGERQLFFVRPKTWGFNPPQAAVHEHELQLVQEGEDLKDAEVIASFDSVLGDIERNLGYLRTSVNPFNLDMETTARRQIDSRRKYLLDMRRLTESLGFPLKRVGTYQGSSVFVQRKKIDLVSPPKPSAGTYVPEPTLDAKAFEEILDVMSNMALVMEKSPSAFTSMKEEDLRSHFLVQLNGTFEGKASGETFNYTGKTDILISDAGKNLFIAECKFWKGAASFTAAIDQLLSYLCWRDTKAALVLFNKDKDFSAVLSQIPELCIKHVCYEQTISRPSVSSFRFLFHSPQDRNRKIRLAVLAFDIPRTPKATP